MTTAEIINRLFRVYPWAVLSEVQEFAVYFSIGHIRYYCNSGDQMDVTALNDDQSHALHLRDVLLGKITKYNERNEVVS